MRIKKVINNNFVEAIDSNGNEVVAMGKGIGFKQKVGEFLNENVIEKIYTSNDNVSVNHLKELLSNIDLEYIQTANEIISFAKVSLGRNLSENIYLTLTDHINFALDRYKNNIEIKNALLWEVKRFYNHEFLIGQEAVRIIKRRLGVSLPEDEAAFIALHIVNAELDKSEPSYATNMMKTIQNILDIVEDHYKIEFDEYSLDYERFITHLKFFVQRLFSKIEGKKTNKNNFFNMLRKNYEKEYNCILKIREYILSEFNEELTENEMTYLMIHINRLTNNKQ